jgi:hypothetical protein
VRLSSRWLIVALLALATVNFVHALPRDVELHPAALGYDFRAFYCAGTVADRGADPYLAGPLRTCEQAVSAQYSPGSNVVIPAPLPGYALALFGVLARLPFAVAATLWVLALLLAGAVTVVGLRALTGLPLGALVAAVVLSDLWVSLVTGQAVPIVVAFVVVAAWCVQRGRFVAAAAAGAATVLEPHVGLAVCLGLFVLVPRTRLWLIAFAVLVGAIAIAAVGVGVNAEYLLRALPAQVAAETAAQEQYSLTYVLHRLGVADGGAILAGNLWYAVLVVAGIAVARRLGPRLQAPSLAALLPAAAGAIGGPYVHLHQVAVVLPAALVFVARVPQRRALFGWAVLLLAIPWGRFLDLRSPLLFVGIVSAVLVVQLIGAPLRTALWTAVGAMLFVYAALDGIGQREFRDEQLAAYGDPNLLASTVWAAFVRAVSYPLRTEITFALVKVPTFAGLALLAYGIAQTLRDVPSEPAPAPGLGAEP